MQCLSTETGQQKQVGGRYAGGTTHDQGPQALKTSKMLVMQATWCAPTMGSFAGLVACTVPAKEGQIASSLA